MSGEIVVLVSGRGSNLRAILESAAAAAVTAIISDNPQAAALQIAAEYDKESFLVTPQDFDSDEEWAHKLLELLQALFPDIIALAGFMRILPPPVVQRFAGRMVNIHPSLLPQFRGCNTHRRALAAAATTHGCTVHYVAEEVDGGDIIAQQKVDILCDDTEEILAARVLTQEHLLYPRVLCKLLADITERK